MSITKVPATSTDDCDILYEKITGSHHCTAHDDIKQCSKKMKCSPEMIQNHQCICESVGPEYPNYAVEELALFLKLQSDSVQCPADVKIKTLSEEIIDLEIENLGDDDQVNSADTENNSDITECEVLWENCGDASDPKKNLKSDCDILSAECTNFLDRCADEPAKKLIIKSESQPPITSPINDPLLSDSRKELKYDSVPLATRMYETSFLPTYVKQANEKSKGTVEKNRKKVSYHHCDVCKCSVASMYDLRLHLLGHVENTKSNVKIYNKSIAALKKIESQVKIDGKRKNVCTMCEKSFRERKQLWHHKMVFHSEGRPWQCRRCHKNYTRSTHLKRHELTHRK